MSDTTTSKAPLDDKFKSDWSEAKAFWMQVHRKWDYNYLMYRSILTYNNIYGEKYLANFGLQVFVPRTFTTIESLAASENVRKTQFTVRPNNNKSRKLTKHVQKLDNIEWYRSGTDQEALNTRKDALIFGMSFMEVMFAESKAKYQFAVTTNEQETAPQDPNDGIPNTDTDTFIAENQDRATNVADEFFSDSEGQTASAESKQDPQPRSGDIQWEERELEEYRGMKAVSWNPYYVFTDPKSTCDADARYKYLYRALPVETAREYVVANGWMTEEEAAEKVKETPVEYFDSIREIIDWMYNMPIYNGYNRGDHNDPAGSLASKPIERQKAGMCLILEKWTRNSFEARLGENEVLVKTFNYFPHKKIPVVTFYDYKVNHEVVGMGEPEIMRHQQIEENKIHNLILQVTLKAVAQRFAIDVSLLEKESDLFDNDPFKPIRMKAGLGKPITDAIMALPQPEVKESPFKLLSLIQDVTQKATAANDFVVSASDSETGTATESNNLVDATSNRIKERLRGMKSSLKEIINQWHPCYFTFYSEAMDLRLTGKDVFVRYLPYDREEANEDPEMLEATNAELDTEGKTLVEAYKLAGYDDVIFISDLNGSFEGEVDISDPQQEEGKMILMFEKVINIANQVNQLAQQNGSEERIDVFKIAKDMIQNLSVLDNLDEYMTTVKEIQANVMQNSPEGQPMPEGVAKQMPGQVPPPEPETPQGDMAMEEPELTPNEETTTV